MEQKFNMDKIICINLGFVVPKNNLQEVEHIFKVHTDWMKEFYSEYNNGKKYLISAYITKATELKDPTNPTKGETGNILFTLNEKFTSIESLERHNENVKKNEYFSKFNQIKKKYAAFRSANGKICHLII
jgi:hypothetical protein